MKKQSKAGVSGSNTYDNFVKSLHYHSRGADANLKHLEYAAQNAW